ncbi:MAG: YfhO family protein [Clostridia bacterium]|nr:YfhO family protein [Clostridia bacterium]
MKKKQLNSKDQSPVLLSEGATLTGEKLTFKQKLASIKKEYGYISLAAIIPAVIFFLIYLARGLYPFGNETVLVLDLNGQYVYFFEELRNTVLNGGSLLYSWSRQLGGEFLGIYAYYIASPLSYLILLFPADKTQEFLLVMFMIKAAICGGTMAFYLHKHSVNKNKLAVVTFAIMYALCAYCVVHQNNTMWIDAVMWLPLVTYGLEELIKYGKYKVFVIFLALTLASNFYIGYMVCIFVLIYYFFYMLAYKDNNVNNPRKEENHFLKSILRVGFFSAVAIAIAAVIVFGAYYSLQFGKNEFTNPSWEIKFKFDFYDLLFKLLPSSYDTVRIDGLPFVYCGLLTVLLAPLFFCSKKFTTREKIASGVLILIFVFSFMISTLDLVWHGFQKPQWLNARFSFMLCFFLIFLAFRAFDQIKSIHASSVAAVATVIFLYLIILQNFEEDFIAKLEALAYGPKDGKFSIHPFATVTLTIVCLVAYVSLIALMSKAKNKDLVAAVLLCVVCGELFFSGLSNINDFDSDVSYSTHSSYNDFTEMMDPIVEVIKEYDDSFYRCEKTYYRKTNDNMLLGIKGLSNSTSTLNKSTIDFLHRLGYYSKSNLSKYQGGTAVTDSLLGIKYIISDRDYSSVYGEPIFSGEDYAEHLGITVDELIESTTAGTKYTGGQSKYYSSNDFFVYYNPNALSLAFAATDAILEVNMKEENSYLSEKNEKYEALNNPDGYTSPFTRVNAILSAILGEEVEVFKAAVQNGDPVTSGCTASISSKHNKYTATGDKPTVTYSYTVPENTMLYLYFPSYYSRAIKLSSSTSPILDNTSSLDRCDDRIVELGAISGTEYSLTVTPNGTNKDFYTKLDDSFIYYIDTEALADVFGRIQENQLVINDNYKDDDIRGTIKTANDDQLVMTTIPYDKGWQVYVDGEKVETFEVLDSLVAFRVDDTGDHTVRFVYRSKAFVFGITLTLVGIAGFVLIIVFEQRLKKLKLVKAIFVVDDTQSVGTKTNKAIDSKASHKGK